MNTRTNLTAIALLVATLLVGANSASAAMIDYDFSVTVDSGDLIGQSYSGHFSFDNAALSGVDNEYLALTGFSFDFLGQHFSLADAVAPAEAAFWQGGLLGIDLIADTAVPMFGFTSGMFDIADAYFAYESVTGNAGYGSIAFNPAVTVPEPGTLSLLFAGLALVGLMARRRG